MNRGLRPFDYLVRACVVVLKAEKRDYASVVKQIYGSDDKVTLEVLRSASAPATTTTTGWADTLARKVVVDLLQSIVSLSAAAELLTRAIQISFDRRQSIILPSRQVSAAYAGTWVGEGQPIPVYQYPVSAGVTLAPHRLAVVTSFTMEMLDQSNIEAFVRSLLSESAALAIDAALFGSQADDGITPPGLLNSVAAVTAAAAGTSRLDAMTGDVENLIKPIAAAGGGANIVFVCSPEQAAAMKALASVKFDYPILASMVIPVGTVIAVESRSLAATIDAVVPEFAFAESPLLQMNTAPGDVVSGGATKSLFQTDGVSLKMILRNIDWKMRIGGHVAWVQNVNW
jgi:hypothetical protein